MEEFLFELIYTFINVLDMKEKYGDSLPYDAYFPSLQLKVEGRTCKFCRKYHSSKKSLNNHIK